MLCIAQLGPTIVLVPVVASYFMHGHTGRGAFLIVVLVLAASLDNVLRTLLIKLYNAWVTVEGLPPEVVPDVESDPAAPALIDESP